MFLAPWGCFDVGENPGPHNVRFSGETVNVLLDDPLSGVIVYY